MGTSVFGRTTRLATIAVAAAATLAATVASAGAATPTSSAKTAHSAPKLAPTAPLTAAQKQVLRGYAADTWKFYQDDVSKTTNLPMDNIGFDGAPQGPYTSPTNIGVYMWSIIDAHDLGLISSAEETTRMNALLTEVEHLEKWDGFLLSWYDTNTGDAITGPGGTSIAGQSLDGQLISTVDNGWYASGLIETRQALPRFAARATRLLNAMNFGLFYDTDDQSTNPNGGQMYGGWIVGQGNAGFEYGMLNTETRIAAYVGIGTGTMPSDVWWRTWRTMPAQFGQNQTPQGPQVTVTDPLTGKQWPVVEGHYSYDGIDYVPSWGGSVFEALMPNLVVPEVADAPRGFGANDVDYTEATIAYDTQTLGYKVWGLSPSSTPDDTGGYNAYGSHALGTDASTTDYLETAVTPHASFLALNAVPQAAFANIQTMVKDYASILGPDGFYDALNPVTGQVGHRYLVLDQSMILTALNDVLNNEVMQHRFANDPVGAVDVRYLRAETMSVTPEPGH